MPLSCVELRWKPWRDLSPILLVVQCFLVLSHPILDFKSSFALRKHWLTDALKETFKSFDAEGKGGLDEEQFGQFVENTEAPLEDREIADIYRIRHNLITC